MKNKLKKMLSGVCAIVIATFLSTPLFAGSVAKFDPEMLKDPFGFGGAGASLGGPYLSIKGSINGGTMNGEGANTNGERVKGSLGTGGFMLGFDVGIDPSNAFIKIDPGDSDGQGDSDRVTVEIGDAASVSIMPMFAVNDNSAIYGKWGTAIVDLAWSGDIQDKTLNSSMRGDQYAVGSRTMLGTNVYLQTELGAYDFEKFSFFTNTGNGTVRPRTAYGSLSLGVKY